MRSILFKEISTFFSTITGYVAVGIFLVITSWFMWISPGEYNVIDGGLASLDTLFFIAPWVFLLLVPAATMRSFAEEKKTGTVELLLTRPLTDLQLVGGKFLGAVVLVLMALIPTLIYLISVYLLANPVGNVDMGATWGSFIGLFFLAAVYAAIGVFSSSLTDNQIVSFILAAVLCLFMYIGFDSLASFPVLKSADSFIVSLGINEHYKSMSKGVIDSRDLIYFVSAIAVFIYATMLKIQSRNWK
jgi:ABC-2 type transport system permease protein